MVETSLPAQRPGDDFRGKRSVAFVAEVLRDWRGARSADRRGRSQTARSAWYAAVRAGAVMIRENASPEASRCPSKEVVNSASRVVPRAGLPGSRAVAITGSDVDRFAV